MGTRHEWLQEKGTSVQFLLSSGKNKLLTMTDASTTLNPDAPFKSRSGLTTPQVALLLDMDAVPTGCSADTAVFRRNSFKRASVVAFAVPSVGPTRTSFQTGAETNRRKALMLSRPAKRSISNSKYAGFMSGESKGLLFFSLMNPPVDPWLVNYWTADLCVLRQYLREPGLTIDPAPVMAVGLPY